MSNLHDLIKSCAWETTGSGHKSDGLKQLDYNDIAFVLRWFKERGYRLVGTLE